MRCVLALLFLLWGTQHLAAQPAAMRHPDSLRAWQPRPKTADTLRLKQLINRARILLSSNLDSAQLLARAAVELAWRRHQGIGLAYGLNNLAAAEYYAAEYLAAQQRYEQTLWAARHAGRPELIGPAYMGLGNVARALNDWRGAERYFVRAQRAYATIPPRDVSGELAVLANRALNFIDADSVALARPLVQQALHLMQQFPEARHGAKIWMLRGVIQRQAGQSDSAAVTFERAIRVARATHDLNPEAQAAVHLANMALQQARPNYARALQLASQAEQLFHTLGDQEEADALRTKSLALVAMHQPGATAALQRYLAMSDSLQKAQQLENVAVAQARFGQAEQQARIRELEQQRRIAGLEETQRRFRSRVLLAALALSAALLAGLGWWLYRRRQAAHEAALRTRLAADLHDDVGSLLTQISLESSLLEEGHFSPTQQQARLQRVAEASRTAARQMRDVVWSVDARNDSFASLLDRMHDHAQEVLASAGLDIEWHIDPALRSLPLPLLTRQNLYLIFKEALHNVVKHAQASEVHIALRLHEGQLQLAVRDNGRGNPTHGEPRAGHGLRNMRMRAGAVGGTVRYEPQQPGFEVLAQLPA